MARKRLFIIAFVLIFVVVPLAGCDFFTNIIGKPQETVLFRDTFSGPASPAWGAVSGTWITDGNWFTITESRNKQWMRTYVNTDESRQWRNYAVDVDIINLPDSSPVRQQEVAILVRALNDVNKVWLKFISDESVCWQIERGTKLGKKRCVSPGLSTQAHVRIEVKGSSYTVLVSQNADGVKRPLARRLQFNNDTFARGMVGLAILDKDLVVFDNFQVTKL